MKHKIHSRKPKNFVLEERIERYIDAIELYPQEMAGHWASDYCPWIDDEYEGALKRFSHVHLDLGCGKGSYLVACAQKHPDTLFIGMDQEPICVVYTAQAICEAGLNNAVVVPGLASNLLDFFAEGELDSITLNFPTPHPRKKAAPERLTNASHLMVYRKLLSDEGFLQLRTDSQPLRDFSLTQYEVAGYVLDWVSDDVRSLNTDEPITEYEQRLTQLGASVYGMKIHPDWNAPIDREALEREIDTKQSLVDYLPEDIFEMDYVPYGMERTLYNLRQYEKKHHKKYQYRDNN